ncbi:DUF6685 family protein [Stutzerimonas nitrititolerans]|uniref:DUF6685 family protein n=1 Tax=Stutzerimonas nitrititolerans TaxID=2482751 RepID=UPI0028B058A0|nr:DUF6685 family protein [Stutzerimonas nitrititolerans]
MFVEQAPSFWKKLGVRLYDTIREDLGYPATLLKLINGPLDLKSSVADEPKGIGSCQVARWHEFGSLHYERSMFSEKLNGWTYCPTYRHYSSTSMQCDDLLHLGSEFITERWRCDIQQVDGFSSSKSELEKFSDMDQMVETNSREMIGEISVENLEKNLSWDEIRIISRVDHDHFASWAWDGRVFLMNSGGSHHFAAAKYIAARINHPVELCGSYKVYGVRQEAVDRLRQEFGMFVLSSESEAWLGFNEAMARFRATYYWKTLPRPHNKHGYAVFLPLTEKRSALVARILEEYGFQDLGAYLSELAARSSSFIQAQHKRELNADS